MTMQVDGEPANHSTPGHDLARLVPLGGPAEWPLASIGDVVAWSFLSEVAPKRVRPWLVIGERASPMGKVLVAVPRLVPESGWLDANGYRAWEGATWRGETSPIPDVLTVAQAARALPRSPTRPRWANQERLVSLAKRADLEGKSASEIVDQDGESQLPSDRARAVRKEIQRARCFLAALGALPWAAFPSAVLPRGPTQWWRHQHFAAGLGAWRRHAGDLTWRRSRESGPDVDLAREAAIVMLRLPWASADPLVVVHARGVLAGSARRFPGGCDEWLEGFIGYAHQTPECRRDLVQRADENGSTRELRAIWNAERG